MASFSEFVRFCSIRTGCDKGGLYAIQLRGLRGSPIKIGYACSLSRRMADWEYSYPSRIDALAVARMNRRSGAHFHKRPALQLAEALLKQEVRQYVAATEEWLTPRAEAGICAAMRRLQMSLTPNLTGPLYEAAQIQRGLRSGAAPAAPHLEHASQRQAPPAPYHLRRKGAEPRCEADEL